ncbi:MAG: DUF547 domain-containing protein [Pseudomonadota bacterium]
MNKALYGCILVCAVLIGIIELSWGMEAFDKNTITYLDVSKNLLEHIKYNEPYADELGILKEAAEKNLLRELKDDAAKKAFLINLYNSFAQILLKDNPALYENKEAFFTGKTFTVSGNKISLNDIERCMLRRTKPMLIPFYIYDKFISSFKRGCRVAKNDYRIHFALNCNARSCPPVLYYDAERIDDQLSLAAAAYLESSVKYSREENSIYLPEIFRWYKSDFGGAEGILNILRQHNIVAAGESPVFRYVKWDWTPAVKPFR